MKTVAFRECVCLVLARLGLGEPHAEYLEDVENLQRAATEWHRLHAAKMGFIHLVLPDDALSSSAIVTGNLCDAVPAGWAANDAARHFVEFIDERTGRRCTLLMLQVLVILQEAVARPKVNASGGAA